jgi:hypothetical protein
MADRGSYYPGIPVSSGGDEHSHEGLELEDELIFAPAESQYSLSCFDDSRYVQRTPVPGLEWSSAFTQDQIEGDLRLIKGSDSSLKPILPKSLLAATHEDEIPPLLHETRRLFPRKGKGLTFRRRNNQRPPRGNNRYGRKGTLACETCRKRNSKVVLPVRQS